MSIEGSDPQSRDRKKSQKVSDSHRNDVSPLTQGLRYRAACDCAIKQNGRSVKSHAASSNTSTSRSIVFSAERGLLAVAVDCYDAISQVSALLSTAA